MAIINIELYHKSISEEFKICQNRVRNLIGSAHWGEDGRYKEIILMNILRRFLPKQFSVGTGFVANNNIITKQIDLIIYDNRFPIIFTEDDFIILSPLNVVGIIEVKTKIIGSQVCEVIEKATNNGEIIGKHKFNGIFAYDQGFNITENGELNRSLERALRQSDGVVNHLSLGPEHFIKYWKDQNPGLENGESCYSSYSIEKLSFSYFISNLIENAYNLSNKIDNDSSTLDFSEMLYSMPQGKEKGRIHNLEL